MYVAGFLLVDPAKLVILSADQDEQPEQGASRTESQNEGTKKVAEEKTTLAEGEEKPAEDDEEYFSSGTDEEEEEEEQIETVKPPEPVKKPVKIEKKISETFFYKYEDLCSLPYVTPDSGIPFGLLALMYPLSSIVYEVRV
ncbi:UNVERIFIED_CONTAM: hypothetical protein K2H54_062817 [Gekko kuhli]